MQSPPPPPHRRLVGTWIVAVIALLEIAGLAAFIEFRDRACAVVAANAGPAAQTSGGLQAGVPQGSAPQTPPAQVPQSAISPAASPAAAAGSANAGDVRTQGDTNQVPDPNCVGKAAAGVLNSDSAQSAPPSCAPMSPPPALKAAEQQVQAGASP